jgi:hypothetical protein
MVAIVIASRTWSTATYISTFTWTGRRYTWGATVASTWCMSTSRRPSRCVGGMWSMGGMGGMRHLRKKSIEMRTVTQSRPYQFHIWIC